MIIPEKQKPKPNEVELNTKKPIKPETESNPIFYDLDYLNLSERASMGDEHARELLEGMIAFDS